MVIFKGSSKTISNFGRFDSISKTKNVFVSFNIFCSFDFLSRCSFRVYNIEFKLTMWQLNLVFSILLDLDCSDLRFLPVFRRRNFALL